MTPTPVLNDLHTILELLQTMSSYLPIRSHFENLERNYSDSPNYLKLQAITRQLCEVLTKFASSKL